MKNRKNPSLQPEQDDALMDCYPDAKLAAIREMNKYLRKNHQLDQSSYPDTCPWSFEQVMQENWLPDH